MFKELGYKLKYAAYAVYWLCLAGLVVLGVFMILNGNFFGYVVGFSSIVNNDYYSIEVDDSDIKIVTIPVGYTHNIENIGDTDMILGIWCNELFDKEHPDTYFKEVVKK